MPASLLYQTYTTYRHNHTIIVTIQNKSLIFKYCIGDTVKMTAMLIGLVFFILFGILLVYEGDKELEYIKQEEKRKREEMRQSFRQAREDSVQIETKE